MNKQRIEKAIRVIRQRIFDMPLDKQERATKAIHFLKNKMNYQPTWHDDSNYFM